MEPRQTPVLFSTMNLCWRHAGKYQWMQMHAFLCAEQSWSMSPTIEQWLFTTQTTRPRALPLWPSTLTSQPVRPPIHLAGLEISFALLRKWRNGTVCVCVCVNDVWFVVFLTWLSDHFFLVYNFKKNHRHSKSRLDNWIRSLCGWWPLLQTTRYVFAQHDEREREKELEILVCKLTTISISYFSL